MNKVFKLLFLLLSCMSLNAQNADSAKWLKFKSLYENPFKSFEKSKIVGLQSSAILSTNQISNAFIYPFLFGKKLETGIIDKTISKSKIKQLHSEINNEIQFVNIEKSLSKATPIYWYVKAGNHSRLYSSASNDAMRLIFKGNTDTNEYKFNNCSYNTIKFNKIGFGIYYINDKTPKPYNLSFGLFGIQVSNYGNVRTYEQNYLKGNEDSLNIGVNYDAVFAKNGLGVSSEIIYNQKIDDLKNWGFSLKNFGLAQFNKNVTTYNAFGEYKFKGVFINDIGRLTDDGYFQNQLDSFTNPLINKSQKQSKLVWIAPISQIYYTIKKGKNYYQMSLKHSGTKALPVAELRFYKFIRPSFLLAFSAGAIGQYYINTDVNLCLTRQWFLQLSISHLEALAIPNTLGGLGGSYGLQFVF